MNQCPKHKTIFQQLAEIPIGAGHGPAELHAHYEVCIGGVAWPCKEMEGYCLVLGMSRLRDRGVHQIYLLDEFQSEDVREIIAKMGAMTVKYRPQRWIGDEGNMAAMKLRYEWNHRNADQDEDYWLAISRSPVLDMDRPYQYLLPQIKQLIGKDHRQLWLKAGNVTNYLGIIDPAMVSEMKIGANPAVEALGYAVMGVQGCIKDVDQRMGPATMGGSRPQSAFVY